MDVRTLGNLILIILSHSEQHLKPRNYLSLMCLVLLGGEKS